MEKLETAFKSEFIFSSHPPINVWTKPLSNTWQVESLSLLVFFSTLLEQAGTLLLTSNLDFDEKPISIKAVKELLSHCKQSLRNQPELHLPLGKGGGGGCIIVLEDKSQVQVLIKSTQETVFSDCIPSVSFLSRIQISWASSSFVMLHIITRLRFNFGFNFIVDLTW